MKKIVLEVEGMTCSACSSGLEKFLKKQKGIKDASVNLVLSLATIFYEEISVKEIEKYIFEAGFKSLGEFKDISASKQQTFVKRKFFIATLAIIFVVFLSMSDMWFGINLKFTNPVLYGTFSLFLAIFFFWYGWDILRNGFLNLLHKIPTMDTLVFFSVGCSFLYSVYLFIQIIIGNVSNVSDLSFESFCMVLYFVKLGRFLEKNSHDKAKDAIENLVQLTPKVAYLKKNEKYLEVSLDEISIGDILICRSGEKIAVDGVVISGKSYVDESFITGESRPALKEKGSLVVAGSVCYDGKIEYEAKRIGKDSMASEIVRLVVESTSTKSKIQRIADQISGYFTPFMLGIAILTFIIYLFLGNCFSSSFRVFVTILVTSCPCALGLAVPLVSVIANGLCAKKGIIVKNSEVFEIAKDIDTVVFDKTGTLTYGKLKVYKFYNYSNKKDEELLKIVSSIEAHSTHPIASSFSKENLLEVEEFQNLEGYAISGKIDSTTYYLGSKKLLAHFHLTDQHDFYESLLKDGCSILYIVSDNCILGLIGVKDILREEVSDVILKLKQRNIQTILLTGDNAVTASQVASALSLSNIISDVLPKEKKEVIENLKKDNHQVMMIGDGINDAPSLVTADIGISIQDGTDIAISSASVIFMNNHLSNVLDLIDISKKSMRIIRQNLFWAFFYNVCMIPIAMGLFANFGLVMNPIYGSIAMIFSSLTVMFNSLRLNFSRKERIK